ncbi:hypothetical protein ACFCV8_15295 [Streptomyces sp. NPDC056347]|uniref:hypothetical protein n=1 Tax=Streptomyces sp. NPDC056347 TaxID=3345790 RepID=UPI0035D8B39A
MADLLVGRVPATEKEKEKEIVSTQEHVVRGIRLQLGGACDHPAAATELAGITGGPDAKGWTPDRLRLRTPRTGPGQAHRR